MSSLAKRLAILSVAATALTLTTACAAYAQSARLTEEAFGDPPLRQVLVDRIALAVSCVGGV